MILISCFLYWSLINIRPELNTEFGDTFIGGSLRNEWFFWIGVIIFFSLIAFILGL
jgi:hypothetical protein